MTAKSTIYTKTGDQGISSLYNGAREQKNSLIFNALGDVDELNTLVGVSIEYCKDEKLANFLTEIQCRLLDIGSNIATPRNQSSESIKLEKTQFDLDGSQIALLESWIDLIDSTLPPLTAFILPSGGQSAVFLHQTRAVCRRAERSVVSLVQSGETDPQVLSYLNRLSDFFFVASRYSSMIEQKIETIYRKPSSSSSFQRVPEKRELLINQNQDPNQNQSPNQNQNQNQQLFVVVFVGIIILSRMFGTKS